MSLTVNIYYSGENGAARKFANEMVSSGTVDAIRKEKGNLQYEYFYPAERPETVLLIDSWEDQKSIDRQALIDFIYGHKNIMPDRIKQWLV